MSNAKDGDHREQVQEGVQKYIAARRSGGQVHDGPSTGRLILEAVVEGVKIYRLLKEEEVEERAKREKERKEMKKHGRKSRSEGAERIRKHHTHKKGHRNQSHEQAHRHHPSGERRHGGTRERTLAQNQEYDGQESPGQSVEGGQRSNRFETDTPEDRRGSPGRSENGNTNFFKVAHHSSVPSSIREAGNLSSPNVESLRNCEHGNTSPQSESRRHLGSGRREASPGREHHSRLGSRTSAPRSNAEKASDKGHGKPALQSAGHHSSSTRRVAGPDGTRFGDLPEYKFKKGLTLGVGTHVVNCYRHVQAEHEVGLRSKGMMEERIYAWRNRNGQRKDKGKQAPPKKGLKKSRPDSDSHKLSAKSLSTKSRAVDKAEEKPKPPSPQWESWRDTTPLPPQSGFISKSPASSLRTLNQLASNYSRNRASSSRHHPGYKETTHSDTVEARERAQTGAEISGDRDIPTIRVEDADDKRNATTQSNQGKKPLRHDSGSDAEVSDDNSIYDRRSRESSKSKRGDKTEKNDAEDEWNIHGTLDVGETQRTMTSMVSDWWSVRTETDSEGDGDDKRSRLEP